MLTLLTATFDDLGLGWHQSGDIVTVTLPGERKLSTQCAFAVGQYAVDVRAFILRRPDENHEAVYRWLLERNLKTYVVAFSVDHHGDVYLTGKLPLPAITAAEIDRVLGVVAATADASFNTLLELGFANSIRAEWRWRVNRGESTTNLEAFQHLAPERPVRGEEPR